MDLRVSQNQIGGGWEVGLMVGLDRRETNELFLAGDALISWPTESMRPLSAGPIERSSMFLSEIVSRPEGLRLVYESEEAASRAAKVLEFQVRSALGG